MHMKSNPIVTLSRIMGDDLLVVSEVSRQHIWDLVRNTTFSVRYYDLMVDRQLRGRGWRNIIHAILAAGVSTALVSGTPYWISASSSFLLIVLSIYILLEDHANQLAILRQLAKATYRLRTEAISLWLDVENYRIDSVAADQRWYRIQRAWNRATADSPATNEPLIRQAAQDTAQEIGAG